MLNICCHLYGAMIEEFKFGAAERQTRSQNRPSLFVRPPRRFDRTYSFFNRNYDLLELDVTPTKQNTEVLSNRDKNVVLNHDPETRKVEGPVLNHDQEPS